MKHLDYYITFEGKHITDKELEAIAKKYTTVKDFIKGDYQAYNTATKRNKKNNGFLKKITSHMSKAYHKDYTDKQIENIAKKYTTIKDLLNNNESVYRAALRKGKEFFNSITAHMNKSNSYLDKENEIPENKTDKELEDIAKKYKYTSDFRKGNKKEYYQAKNKGIDFFYNITSHMKTQKIRDNEFSDEETEKLINYIENGKTAVDISILMNIPYKRILGKINNLKNKDNTPDKVKNDILLKKHTAHPSITEDKIKKIIKLYDEGKSSIEIGSILNYSPTTTNRIIQLTKEARNNKISRFSKDYTEEEMEELVTYAFNLNSFCEKWRRGNTEIQLKLNNLMKKISSKNKNNWFPDIEEIDKRDYFGGRVNKIIKNIVKNTKVIKKQYDEVPKKHFVQSELLNNLKGINCSVLTLLGPTPNRYLNLLNKLGIIGNNDIFSYEIEPDAFKLISKDIVDNENIHLMHGNIIKAKAQKFIDLDLTGRWDTQGDIVKSLFNKQKLNIDGNKYFMFTLSLFGKNSSELKTSELINYIRSILEELLSEKIILKPEIISFTTNESTLKVIKCNTESVNSNFKIIVYKYTDTSPMMSVLITYS
jgi:hypothetical protein